MSDAQSLLHEKGCLRSAETGGASSVVFFLVAAVIPAKISNADDLSSFMAPELCAIHSLASSILFEVRVEV